MATLKELRTRINSVTSTKQITSAMKMVSVAKLQKAQNAITQIRPYAHKLYEILTHVSSGLDTSENIYARKSELKKILIVAIASNKGLCGAFNTNIMKQVMHIAREDHEEIFENNKIDFIAIGKKAEQYFKRNEISIINQFNDIFENLSFDAVIQIADYLMHKFTDREYDRIYLVYNEFKNPAVQRLITEQFLPIKQIESDTLFQSDYIFEPSKQYVVEDLIPKSLKVQFYKALLESHASEHGARMTAMHKATDNATEMLRDLHLYYNKARQASITNEIIEIVSGAEALGS